MTGAAAEPVLSVTGLRVRRGRREVLHGVDLHVPRGELVALLGPNGAGKSTLLGALSGTVPTADGTVIKRGRIATTMQSPGLARRTARANVELALGWWGVPPGQRRARADAALTRMRAAHLADRPAAALSGGERRRVHLARAVAVRADLTLLDEPFDGLDPSTHEELREDLVAALRAEGSAAVVVLHDRADAWAIADRVVVLVDGVVHADGPPRQLQAAPPTPQVARLLGYDGEIELADDSVRLVRSSAVRLDPLSKQGGRVVRVVPTESGARVNVELDTGGTVWALSSSEPPTVGETVRVRVESWAEFDARGRPR